MWKHAPVPRNGARSPARPLRLLVAVLAVLQLAAPLAALAVDPPPVAAHVDHVGSPDDACHTFHDELFCLSCRLLATQPVRGDGELPPVAPAEGPGMVVLEDGLRVPTSPLPASALARAPPRI